MPTSIIQELLRSVQDGTLSIEDAAARLRTSGGSEEAYAHVDTDRARRTGHPEVVYGQGKQAQDIVGILKALHEAGQKALATRVDPDKAAEVLSSIPEVIWHERARILEYPASQPGPTPEVRGRIAVVCAGTSDLPVAEEAAIIAEAFGNPVDRFWDVGVAGIHRLLGHMDALRAASVIIVVAGMEGALASVVAGMVPGPVIAVPTSVGYGASFGGVAALLGMLNSCAAGVSVVNIDNGFGAAVQAARINRVPSE
jgi:NCAIR mutase (PurE)-related protein